jgi:hypothetical protein
MKTPVGLWLILVLGLVIGSSSMASAQVDPWTAVGTTGTVDEEDLSIVDMVGTATVQVKSTAPLPSTVDIRYNIVAVEGVFSPSEGISMQVRFRDNGTGGRVVARLRQISFSTGAITTLLVLDSDTFPASNGFQTRSVSTCGGNVFNFLNNAYYIDLTITKFNTTGAPALQLLQVGGNIC